MADRQIKLWVEALESDEYGQTSGVLRGQGGYCCLGVACDLYKKSRHRGRWASDDYDFIVDGRVTFGTLEESPVGSWLGLTQMQETDYIIMNDRGSSFKEIAKKVRKDFKKVFSS